MRGISKQPVPYVLDRDRGVPEDEQTTFWVKPRTGEDGARIVTRYTGAERANPGAYREISPAKWGKADIETWLDTIVKVENFWFSDTFPELAAQGWITEVTDPDMLVKVMKSIALEDFNELINFASRVSTLTPVEKNGLSSSRTSSSGEARSENGR
jgi:hypothetical protein